MLFKDLPQDQWIGSKIRYINEAGLKYELVIEGYETKDHPLYRIKDIFFYTNPFPSVTTRDMKKGFWRDSDIFDKGEVVMEIEGFEI